MLSRPLAVLKFIVAHWKLSLLAAFVFVVYKTIMVIN